VNHPKKPGIDFTVVDPRSLPDRAVPIPGAKPPVYSLPYKDNGRPEEVDTFRELIREIRQ
jgi:hypothetical protein